MLSNAQEKLIKSLHTKKGRQKKGQCLVEGEKNVQAAGDLVEFTFSPADSDNFTTLVTTQAPQQLAAVARIPEETNIQQNEFATIVVLDGVQDPGNVGSLLRLCQGFKALLILVESADVTNPKVIRSSAGAFFNTPWTRMSRAQAEEFLAANTTHDVFRLEKRDGALPISHIREPESAIIIAGSEGNGIQLPTTGQSTFIPHENALESLNVTHAVAIALHTRYETSLH